jgi:pyruvate,orthophosphate dikinase
MTDLRKHLFFILPNAADPDPTAGAAPPAPSGPVTATAAAMGSKAAGLLRLAQLDLPVPPAFVLGTAICREYFAQGGRLPGGTRELLAQGLSRLEQATGLGFGSARRPLLVSVRSGAPVSMPGMLQTILNIGLCEHTIPGLLRSSGNPRLTRDCYRRLVRDFTEVVHGADAAQFDALVDRHCMQQSLATASELDSAALGDIAAESLELALALTGQPFPQDPMQQLLSAVEAVFRSWNDERARQYRRINGIDDAMGTAVTVQAMVFGNGGGTSGAGVGFTRDPATGENRLYLDFLFNAQGEDVVSGRHAGQDSALLPQRLPQLAAELGRVRTALESEFRDMQDFEFTVERSRLFLLQTRAGKRTPWSALRIAVDMVNERLITPAEALARLDGIALEQIERMRLADDTSAQPLATAVPASIGVASGAIVFEPGRAAELASRGESVILVRPDISTADVAGIAAAAGVLTAAGSRTSHAAVVARQLGKVCLVDCRSLQVRPQESACTIGAARLVEGEVITLDADHGRVYAGRLPLVRERPTAELDQVAAWREEAGCASRAESRPQ